MGELFGAGPDHPYQERLKLLMANGIALWDVLESCYRPGSLDAAIDVNAAKPNDFTRLFGTHPSIARVFFNGGKAEACYRRRVLPAVQTTAPGLIRHRPAPPAQPWGDEQERADRRHINRPGPRVISAGHSPRTALRRGG
jgi:hypoxanthine-DNA glycosylase